MIPMFLKKNEDNRSLSVMKLTVISARWSISQGQVDAATFVSIQTHSSGHAYEVEG